MLHDGVRQREVALAGLHAEIGAGGFHFHLVEAAVIDGDGGIVAELIEGLKIFGDAMDGAAEIVGVGGEESAGLLGQVGERVLGVAFAGVGGVVEGHGRFG